MTMRWLKRLLYGRPMEVWFEDDDPLRCRAVDTADAIDQWLCSPMGWPVPKTVNVRDGAVTRTFPVTDPDMRDNRYVP